MYAITAPRCTMDYRLGVLVQKFILDLEELKKLFRVFAFIAEGQTETAGIMTGSIEPDGVLALTTTIISSPLIYTRMENVLMKTQKLTASSTLIPEKRLILEYLVFLKEILISL